MERENKGERRKKYTDRGKKQDWGSGELNMRPSRKRQPMVRSEKRDGQ